MGRRPEIALLLVATFVSWMGQRIAAIALPLVALDQTGEPWTTGLVGGMAGIPVVTAPWWGRGIRNRLTSGRSIALVMLVQVAGLLVVPVAAGSGALASWHLCLSGLVTGGATAVASPARTALMSDIADGVGPQAATRALAWQDLAHRISMVIAPPLAAVAIGKRTLTPLLWAEALGVAVAAVALCSVSGSARHLDDRMHEDRIRSAVSVRMVLRRHPEIRAGVLMEGVGGLVWFAFTLGLALAGAAQDRPGELVGAAMAGYGAGSLLGASSAAWLVPRLPRVPTMVAGWVVLGTVFVLLPMVWSSVPWIVVVCVGGGVAMPLAIGALNSLVATRTAGDERRAAFAGAAAIHEGAAAFGLLVGGGVVGLLGPSLVLVAAGVVQVGTALAVGLRHRAGGIAPSSTAPTRDVLS